MQARVLRCRPVEWAAACTDVGSLQNYSQRGNNRRLSFSSSV